jgi:hypothetical protein
MYAIFQSLCSLTDRALNYVLFSDSKAALQAIINPNNTNPLAVQIRNKTLTLLRDGFLIEFSWIRGHANNPGNELADHLAKTAAMSNITCHSLPYPLIFIKKSLKTWLFEQWNTSWINSKHAFTTKLFFPTVFSRQLASMDLYNPITTMFLTGHGPFQAYYFRFGLSQTNICACSQGPQDIQHLLLFCPCYHIQRQDLIQKLLTIGYTWPVPFSTIFQSDQVLKLFTTFFKILIHF